MVERGYGSPKVSIFGIRGRLLYESTAHKVCGDGSLKHVIDSLRVVQKETNEFLTCLVKEQSSKDASINTAVPGKDSDDEDDDEDDEEEENSALTKKRKQD